MPSNQAHRPEDKSHFVCAYPSELDLWDMAAPLFNCEEMTNPRSRHKKKEYNMGLRGLNRIPEIEILSPLYKSLASNFLIIGWEEYINKVFTFTHFKNVKNMF